VAKAVNDDKSFAQVERLLKRLEVRVPGYPRDLAVLVRLAAHIEKKMIEVSNITLKPYGLNYAMYQVLVISLGSDAATATALADATGERPTNITHICDELEKRELLVRDRDTHDRRRVQIALTEQGRELLCELQPLMWQIWRTRYQGISAGERKQLLELMRRQYQNLGGA
jgi:MarR family transcriptional repressor of emrRAB